MFTGTSSDVHGRPEGPDNAHWEIDVDPKQQLAVITAIGSGSVELIRAAAAQLVETPGWTPGYDVVWDMARLRRVVITPDDVPSLLSVPAAFNFGNGRSAFIVSDEVYLGIAQLLVISQRRATERENRAFTDRQAAFDWLGKRDPAA